jgi:hypothetical protein
MVYQSTNIPKIFYEAKNEGVKKQWETLTRAQQDFIRLNIKNVVILNVSDIQQQEVLRECQANITCQLTEIAKLYQERDIPTDSDQKDVEHIITLSTLQMLAHRHFSQYEVFKDLLMIPLGEQLLKIRFFGMEKYLLGLGIPENLVGCVKHRNSQVNFSQLESSINDIFARLLGLKKDCNKMKLLIFILYSGCLQREMTILKEFPPLIKRYRAYRNTHFLATSLGSFLGVISSLPLGSVGTFIAPALSWLFWDDSAEKNQVEKLRIITGGGLPFLNFCRIIEDVLDAKSEHLNYNNTKKILRDKILTSNNLLEAIKKEDKILYDKLNLISLKTRFPIVESRGLVKKTVKAEFASIVTQENIEYKPEANQNSIVFQGGSRSKSHLVPKTNEMIIASPKSLIEAYKVLLKNTSIAIFKYWIKAQICSLELIDKVESFINTTEMLNRFNESMGVVEYAKKWAVVPSHKYILQTKGIKKTWWHRLRSIAQEHYYLVMQKSEIVDVEQKNKLAAFFPASLNF